MESTEMFRYGEYSIISNKISEDNGKLYIWDGSRWNFIYHFDKLTINNIGGNGSNDGFKAIFYGGSITKLKNKTYVDTKKFVNSDGIFSVELHKKTNFNTNIIDIIESNTINLKMIGVYKITYNVSWYLNDTIDCDKYLQANRDGILGFCQENTYNLIETSINRCKGNSFYVNLTHTFLYEKLTDNKSQINLYIYKLFKPYKDDLIINSSNTWLQIEFNPL